MGVHPFPTAAASHDHPRNPRGFAFSETTSSPYLNAEDGARYLRLFVRDATGAVTDVPNVRAFYQFLRRHGITKLGRERRILVDRRELDAALHPVKAVRRAHGGAR